MNNTQIENELSRIAQLVQEDSATSERDTIVLHTSIYLNPTADELQISGYPRTYFIADRAYEITSIREVHDTLQASADGAALQIAKLTGTTAPTIEHDGLNIITTAAYVGSAFTLRGFDL